MKIMRKEELFLGAWIYIYSYDNPEKNIPVQVKGVFENDNGVVYVEFVLNGERGSRPLLNCRPIPITNEILEKNGWDTSSGYITHRLDYDDRQWIEYYPFERRLTKYSTVPDEWNNHSKQREIIFKMHCTYVHEFQKGLEICGSCLEIKM